MQCQFFRGPETPLLHDTTVGLHRVAPVVRSPTGRASTVGPRPLGAVKDAEQITGLLFEPFSAVSQEQQQ